MTETKILPLLKRAQSFCEEGKHRFTEPRKRVLSILLTFKKPMGAYEILNVLSSDTRKINPPTIYRAIEFWHQHGFVHKIESINAYIACCHHKYHKNFCIFICNKCHSAIELELKQLSTLISNIATKENLIISESITEMYGQCQRCQT